MRQTYPWLEVIDYASFPIDAWEERLWDDENELQKGKDGSSLKKLQPKTPP
jgi:hypothetical protein